jgi:hypothetical protein
MAEGAVDFEPLSRQGDKTMSSALSLLIYAAEWGLAGIILYFVIEMIAMPPWAKRVCQALLILIGVLAVIGALLGQPTPVSRLSPIPPAPPSITR